MKVILLSDVRKVGKKDDIIDVSDGYANNYLIKNKLAVPYTKKSKDILDNEIEKRNVEEQKLIDKLNIIKDKLDGTTLTFKVKSGKEDRVFGKVSTKQISDELKKQGYDIDKKCITLDHDLDTLGTHEVEIVLHKKVKFKMNIVLSK